MIDILSWNIEGKHYILKNKRLKNSLNAYDILFIHETHASREMEIKIDGYSSIQHPCMRSSNENPRGGCIMYIREDLMKYVEGIDKNYNDTIVLYMAFNLIICGMYIPPTTSKYFDDHFDILDVYSSTDSNVIICGDLNARVGNLKLLNGLTYKDNPDPETNQHGKALLDLCKSNDIAPLNMLTNNGASFEGGFTFQRHNQKSQNDWILSSRNCLKHVVNFQIIDDLSGISDHTPLSATLEFSSSPTLEQANRSIDDILDVRNNHSRVKKMKKENIDMNVFKNIMTVSIGDLENKYKAVDVDAESLAGDIENALQKAARSASKKSVLSNKTVDADEALVDDYRNLFKRDAREEHSEWDAILKEGDPKKVWQKIDFNGKFKNDEINSENTCDEFAEFLEARCSLPYEHSNYEHIECNVYDEEMDGHITQDEILNSAKTMNKNSASKCGTPVAALLTVICPMLGLLELLMNIIFKSSYPASWVPFISCLPKKGKLNIPCVRGISMKALLAKLYDGILKNRLTKWLKIPPEQTAYQKKKNCALHVFFVRCLVAICKKLKITLFIGVTDFEAAFDYISRRNLFIKLANLGIGVCLLNALIEMYKVSDAYVFLDGEYSRKLAISAGVLQGSASSTLLFMAYTSDLIDIFREHFPAEEIINLFHILLHADDSLILATSKDSLIRKFKKLDEYCLENNIKLQLSKCCFLAINSDEKSDIVLERGTICNESEFVYLGSIITDSGNVSHDLKAEIKKKEKKLNKFFAFTTQNHNAPLEVKEKVLDSCIVSTALNNCESWGNANLKDLELKYRKSLKYMLGVRKSTCNEFPYVELAKPSITSQVYKRQLTFYRKCLSGNDFPLQRYIIKLAVDSKCSFIDHYVQLDLKYREPEDITAESLSQMKQSIEKKANNNKSRYKAYLEMNPTLSRPNIYSRYIQTFKLLPVIRLRTVSHNLEIERARHTQHHVPQEQRLCSCGVMEDEQHFVLSCHHYTHIREKYDLQRLPLPQQLDDIDTPDFIYELFRCRDLYLQK